MAFYLTGNQGDSFFKTKKSKNSKIFEKTRQSEVKEEKFSFYFDDFFFQKIKMITLAMI